MDRGAWQAITHGITKNWTWLKWLSMHTYPTHRDFGTEKAKGVRVWGICGFFSSINNLLFITCRYMWKYKVVPHFLGDYILSPRLNKHYYFALFALYVLKTFYHGVSSLKVDTIVQWTPMCCWRVSIITNSCQACFTSVTSQLSPPPLAYLKANPRHIFVNKYFSLHYNMHRGVF